MSDLNDPRVFFAAERTLLAWNRTSLALMGFGFVIERFGLFMKLVAAAPLDPATEAGSFWIGLVLILLGSALAVTSVLQYRQILKTLKPVEIPAGYWVGLGVAANLLVAAIGVALAAYLLLRL